MVRRGDVRPDERIVVISTAHGLKFTSFKTRYHNAEYEDIKCKLANPPIEVQAKYDSVRDALFRSLDARNAQMAKP